MAPSGSGNVWRGAPGPVSGDSSPGSCGEQHACELPPPAPASGARRGGVAARVGEERLAESREVPTVAGAGAGGGGVEGPRCCGVARGGEGGSGGEGEAGRGVAKPAPTPARGREVTLIAALGRDLGGWGIVGSTRGWRGSWVADLEGGGEGEVGGGVEAATAAGGGGGHGAAGWGCAVGSGLSWGGAWVADGEGGRGRRG
ncbi:uncharacterized protein [Miscanthus floridulus]|uniref:uncharacterized protein n=1 Tax=Miscanthus floridulus TaxID=154761 RepID=UPI003457FF12